MGIVDRVIDGLCDIEAAAKSDEFFARWKDPAAQLFGSAATVARRIKEGLHPHPMGQCTADLHPSSLNADRNIRDKTTVARYDRFLPAIDDFWVVCLARTLHDILKVTGETALAFRQSFLARLPSAVFPPGAQLHQFHDLSLHGQGPRTTPEMLKESRLTYVRYFLGILSSIDPEGQLAKQAEEESDDTDSDALAEASLASTLSAAIVARTLALYGSQLRDPVAELLSPGGYSSGKLSKIPRGQTIFHSKSALKSVWADAVVDSRLIRFIAQRESHVGDPIPETPWRTLKVQPGRYGDQFNAGARNAVLTPGRAEHFNLAATCTIIDHELSKYPAPARGIPVARSQTGSHDVNRLRAASLRQEQARAWLDSHGYGAAFADAARRATADNGGSARDGSAPRLLPSTSPTLSAAKGLLASGALDLVPALDWSPTRHAYTAELKVDWEALDESGNATRLDLVVVARQGERYEVLPHELDELDEDWYQLLIPAWCFGDLTPVHIVHRMESGLWGAHSDGETLVICLVLDLPQLCEPDAD